MHMKSPRSFIALVIALTMLTTLFGCGAPAVDSTNEPTIETTLQETTPAETTETSTPYQPGTYTGSGIGFHGVVEVEVTVDENSITNVAVTAQTETTYVGTVALDTLPQMIVENQSLADTITGATFSSNALKYAVKDALTQAGASEAHLETLSTNKKISSIPADNDADILIIGAGGAGMSAALEAADSGLDVILIEKQGMTGGSTRLSGGTIWAIGSEQNDIFCGKIPDCYSYTPEDVVAHIEEYCGIVRNPEILLKVGRISGETLDNFCKDGYTIVYPTQNNQVAHTNWYSLCTKDAGAGTANYLTSYVLDRDIDLRLNTRATELLTNEAGAVIGAKVLCDAGEYTITAKKTILATGGFTHNADMMAEYCEGDYENSIYCAAVGSTGDGHIMGTSVGGYLIGEGALGITCVSNRVGTEVALWNPFFHVNAAGEKIMRSDEYYPKAQEIINDQTNGLAFTIYGSDSYSVDTLEAYTAAGLMTKADTLEELAAALGIDPVGLVQSVKEHNDCIVAGTTDTFGSNPTTMKPITQAPYYGCRRTATIMGTIAGLAVNDNFHVLRQDGTTVENLYAVGEVMFGNVMDDLYPLSGTALATAINGGRLAVQDAVDALK